jgi:CrcB protein
LKAALLNAALVGTGGFIGAICRYGLSGLVQRHVALAAFPYGTLTVNLLGCLLIGIAVGLVDTRQVFGPEFRLFALLGLLGGFTTYSTFGYETFALLRDADYLRAVANVTIHVVLGLALVWAGYAITSR